MTGPSRVQTGDRTPVHVPWDPPETSIHIRRTGHLPTPEALVEIPPATNSTLPSDHRANSRFICEWTCTSPLASAIPRASGSILISMHALNPPEVSDREPQEVGCGFLDSKQGSLYRQVGWAVRLWQERKGTEQVIGEAVERFVVMELILKTASGQAHKKTSRSTIQVDGPSKEEFGERYNRVTAALTRSAIF